MFEFLTEGKGIRRAVLDAQSAESAHPQVINMLVNDAFRFPILADFLGCDDLDRTIWTVVFTDPATVAAMLVVLVVNHYDLAPEALEHLEILPVLGILLCYDLPGTEKILACYGHPCRKGFHTVGNI